MKIKDIRELSVSDLRSRKLLMKEEIFHLRIRQQSGQLEKPSQVRLIRREIAQFETVLSRKSQAAKAAKQS